MPHFSLSPKGGNYGYSFSCFLNMLACMHPFSSLSRVVVFLFSCRCFFLSSFVLSYLVVVSRDFILGATPPTPAAFLCTKPQGEKGRSKGAEQESFLRLLASHPSLSHVKQTNPTSPQTDTHTRTRPTPTPTPTYAAGRQASSSALRAHHHHRRRRRRTRGHSSSICITYILETLL